mmetsp:Transcript_9049/g.27053  ORF Transcript_9049/g.27053 Transcript_9049/m.27053 type:complete len:137 (+) Transcript_9049:859-1269(+)
MKRNAPTAGAFTTGSKVCEGTWDVNVASVGVETRENAFGSTVNCSWPIMLVSRRPMSRGKAYLHRVNLAFFVSNIASLPPPDIVDVKPICSMFSVQLGQNRECSNQLEADITKVAALLCSPKKVLPQLRGGFHCQY